MEIILFGFIIGIAVLMFFAFRSDKGTEEVSASLLSSSIGKSLGATSVLSAMEKDHE